MGEHGRTGQLALTVSGSDYDHDAASRALSAVVCLASASACPLIASQVMGSSTSTACLR